jgi:hypothetical protein
MRKRVFFIAIIVVMIILACIIVVKRNTNKLDIKQLNGQLLIENNIDNKDDTYTYAHGALICTASNGDLKKVFSSEDYYTPYCLNQDKSKMLLLKHMENPAKNDYVIFEYDLKTKVLTGIVKYNKDIPNSTIYYTNIKYIPGKHQISYLWNGKLYVFDMDSKIESLIMKGDDIADSNYGWSEDGNKLIYEKENNINILDLSTHNKNFVTGIEGFSPIYSQSEKYIAYLDDFVHSMKVRDMKTGEEWTYSTDDMITSYVFSPDDKYLAIVEKDVGIIKSGAHFNGHVKVWDFKNSAFGTLIKYYKGDTIDWK